MIACSHNPLRRGLCRKLQPGDFCGQLQYSTIWWGAEYLLLHLLGSLVHFVEELNFDPAKSEDSLAPR